MVSSRGMGPGEGGWIGTEVVSPGVPVPSGAGVQLRLLAEGNCLFEIGRYGEDRLIGRKTDLSLGWL